MWTETDERVARWSFRVWLIVGAAALAVQVLPTLGAARPKPGLRAALDAEPRGEFIEYQFSLAEERRLADQ